MTDDRGRITVFLFFQKKKTTVIGHRSSAIDVSCRDRMRQTGNTYPKPRTRGQQHMGIGFQAGSGGYYIVDEKKHVSREFLWDPGF